MTPEIQGLDHIHIAVPDKDEAAAWYRENLGFSVVESLKQWDKDGGPLTIGRGDIHLALFSRESYSPLNAVAFRCSGPAFMEWEALLARKGILDRCTDHDLSWSLYFDDPYGHSHEITSYDHAYIKDKKGV